MCLQQGEAHLRHLCIRVFVREVGEQMDLLALFEEELDDWVPLVVVQRFVKQFIQAYANLFRDLGLHEQ